jgi:spermidine synthase
VDKDIKLSDDKNYTFAMENERVVYKSTAGLMTYYVVDTIYNDRSARVLYSEDRIAAESGMAFDNGKEQLFDYNERFMELIRGVLPKNILLIGGGAFTLPKAINEEFPEMALDVVELDPVLYKLSKKYFGFKPNSKTRVFIQDGNDYLKSTKQRYDLILVDVFLNNIIPVSFQSVKFTKGLKLRLAEEGVVAMNIIASYYGRLSNPLKSLLSVFRPSFVSVHLFPAYTEESLWIPQNFILVSQRKSREIQSFLRYEQLELPKLD